MTAPSTLNDRIRQTAHGLIKAILAEDWFTPEGLELYDWKWVPAESHTLRVDVMAPVQLVGELPTEPNQFGGPTTIEIGRIVTKKCTVDGVDYTASAGWNVDERVAVLFFWKGGKLLLEEITP